MNSFDVTFKVFKKNYKPIPLEYFKNNPFKILVSTLLSSRTKDEVTLEASMRLFEHAPNLKKLYLLKQSKIRNLIYPVGFYKTKAKHLKKLAEILIMTQKKEIPKTREDLMKLPGVGRKTANLVLNRAFGIPAIAVDTHVHKISNMLDWVKTRSPEETEKELTKILPKRFWSETNRLIVSIGRQFTTHKELEKFLRSYKLIE